MDSRELKQLLDKYFKAETSLEEEQQLKEAFRDPSGMDRDLLQYQAFFGYLDKQRTEGVSSAFDQKLEARLREVSGGLRPLGRRFSPWLRVAAGLALLIGLFWVARLSFRPSATSPAADQWAVYETDDPQKALEETMKALALVSNKFKKAEDATVKGLSGFEKIETIKK